MDTQTTSFILYYPIISACAKHTIIYTLAVSPIMSVPDTKKKLRGFKIFALQLLSKGSCHDSSGTAVVPQPTLTIFHLRLIL